jgi:MFS family permease
VKPTNPVKLISFIRKFWFLLLVLVIEGASLMAVELMGAKLLAPFYGSSLYVWTAVLGITVLGLSLGYFFGGKLSANKGSEKLLILILGIAALLVFAMPATAKVLISLTSSLALVPGICISSFFLLVPPMFCFGLVGPMVVRLMTNELETIGTVAGTVFFTSTLGGILATFLIGYILIPESGLRFSALVAILMDEQARRSSMAVNAA